MTGRLARQASLGDSDHHPEGDPIRTEVVRHSLCSAAEQMKRALVRTAFSPVIYEVLDFAVAIYDPQVRLLAQAPSLPLFMGRLSFCVQAAVEAVGGEEALEPGDIILYNHPFGTGSHPQDAALVMPVFLGGELLGYSAVKGHWLDIGGKDPYATDTVDMFQEGTIFPGVKLYAGGRLADDILRVAQANSRVPAAVAGDIHAEVTAVRIGGRELKRVVVRHGVETFWESVEHMFDHGEAVVRSYFEHVPDGRYVGTGEMDDDGVEPGPVRFEIALEIRGSDVTIDFSAAPGTRRGPVNSALPKTVAASRVAVAILAGAGEPPNEGHFRPIQVITRPDTMFHPLPPAPTFIGGWAAIQAIDVIYRAVAQALPELAPAASAGDICSLVWWGRRKADGEPWADGSPHSVGQGADAHGDGASALMHVSEAATRITPTEVWEARNPWLVEKIELAADSCGAGRYRGGLGVDYRFRMLEDAFATAVVDRTRNAPWGLAGGTEARPNGVIVEWPDGRRERHGKATRLSLPARTVLELQTGGGGGFGSPTDRDPEAVLADVREGYLTEGFARRYFPHAFDPASDAYARTCPINVQVPRETG